MSNKIDNELFSAHEHALDTRECPACGADMHMRHGKHGPFWGCSQYPSCEHSIPLHSTDSRIIKELGVPCPQCANELVLRQGRYGMFVGCSYYPQCTHVESLHQAEPETADHIACPECETGHLVERKSRYGKTFHACDQYPSCKFSVNLSPVAGCCQTCQFPLLLNKPTSNGDVLVCADKKCQAKQV